VNGWEYGEKDISKMDDMPEVMLDLILFDNPMPPKEISACLGVTATEALLKGERNERLVLPRGNLWSLYSKGGGYVEDEWAFLKKKLEKSWDKFIEITQLGGTTKIAVVVRIMSCMPPVYMPASMIKDAAEMGAIIDVEYYNYTE